MTILGFIICILAIAEQYADAVPSNDGSSGCMKDYRVEYLMLSTTWQPGACQLSPHECTKKRRFDEFYIHGLWPQNRYTHLAQCCSNQDWSPSSIARPLLWKLHAYWSPVKDMPPEIFWHYEYNTHGTCASKIGSVDTPARYMETTTRLFESLNLKKILQSYDIVPDNHRLYTGQMIEDAFYNELGVEVTLTCRPQITGQRIMLLQEVRVCYGLDMKLIDCPIRTSTKCRAHLLLAKH